MVSSNNIKLSQCNALLRNLNLIHSVSHSLYRHMQALGLAGCGRKRQLLLWSALDMFRAAAGAADKSAPPSDAAAMMRLALRSLMPHETPQQQVLGW